MPIEHRHARLAGMSMHYSESGTGKAVVLLHGWPSTWY